MDKITIKDIKKTIPMGIRIKASTKRAIALPKRIFNSVKKFYNNATTNLVTEEMKNNAINKQVDKLETKREKLYGVLSQMVEQEEFTTGKNKYYTDVVADEIIRLENKVIKRKNKGLGKFALAKITLSAYLKTKKEKSELKKNIKKQIIIENKEAEIAKELEETINKKTERQNKIKQILTSNPNLVEYYNNLLEEEKEKVKTK